MADDLYRRDTPDLVRRDRITPDRASSRLLRRGLHALKPERVVPLKVIDLIAFEDSVFVLSDDWDESEFVKVGKCDVGNRRVVVVYEFNRWGGFVGRVGLPLVGLSANSSSRLTSRQPSALVVRGEFIYFWEDLEFDYSEMMVEMHYIFSRRGELLDVWSNDEDLGRYGELFDASIRIDKDFQADWVTSEFLVSIAPKDRPLYSGNLYIGDGDTPHHIITRWPTSKFVNGSMRRDSQSRTLERSQDRAANGRHKITEVVEMPFKTDIFHGGSFWHPGWICGISDSHAVWFLSYDRWSRSTRVSRLAFHADKSHIESYLAPTASQLVRARAVQGVGDSERVSIEYQYMKAWDDTIVLGGQYSESNTARGHSVLIICRVMGDRLSIVGELWDTLQSSGIGSTVGLDSRFHLEDDQSYDQLGFKFSGGHLYGFSDDVSNGGSVVMISDLQGNVTQFIPKLPVSWVDDPSSGT